MVCNSGRLARLMAVALPMCAVGRAASASIFSSISYYQYVDVNNGPTPSARYLIGTTLPVLQTLGVNIGPSAQATYNFSDSGDSATLEISTVESLDGPSQNAGEFGDSANTYFTLAQPVFYHFVFQDTVSPSADGGGSGGVAGLFGGGPDFANSSYESDGILQAGVAYVMLEGFELNNNAAGKPSVANGTSDLLFTFTAIPEPSSLCLIAAIGAGLLSRRRTRSSPRT